MNVRATYSTAGSLYTQSFDSLPNTPTNTSIEATYTDGWQDDVDPGVSAQNDVSIPGWYLDHRVVPASENGFNGHQRMRFGSGSSGTGAFYSFGANSSTERALGALPATTLATNGDSMTMALRLTNTTGLALTTFTITYDGEQYRDGAADGSLSFSYAMNVDETDYHTAGVNAVFVSAATFAPADANPGTAAATSITVPDITATVNFASPWLPGEDLFLRWREVQVTSLDDDGLAIDNVRFTADVPEPAGLGLLALAGLVVNRRRRSS